jgi:hypothetical protein
VCGGKERVRERGRVQRERHRGSRWAFIERAGREGETDGVMAINVHGSGRLLQGIQGGT